MNLLSANLLSAAGVFYDIVGAFLIVRAIVFARPKILAAQSASVINRNPTLFAALDQQQHDGQFGTGILIAGFVFQLLAALGCGVSVAYWPWFAVALAGALGAYFAVGVRRKRTREARLDQLLKGVKRVEELL